MLSVAELTWRQACAAALAGLPAMGPSRIAALLSDMAPEDAWASLAAGEVASERLRKCVNTKEWPTYRSSLLRHIRRTEPLEVLERYDSLGIEVWTPMATYPERLINDPWCPLILFATGAPKALNAPTVALIGTRHCTIEGRRIAERFGRELSEAGVSVVSGLALGIDGAAHQGALDSRSGALAIGVVGSGLDVVYPRRHARLWQQVAAEGLLLGESPLGTAAERWRFPARNRIIAGLADVIVVVESHERGGSLLTVDEAIRRDRPVMAVPGSINSPASRGTNQLLRDGCGPACSTDDVLSALSLVPSPSIPIPVLPAVSPDDDVILDAVDWQPTATDEVMTRTGKSLGEVAETLTRLQQRGYVVGMGGWWQRVAETANDGSF